MQESQVYVYEDRVEWKTADGKLHRKGGPAREIHKDGEHYIEWYENGELHNETGPAVFNYNGVCEWRIRGKIHRMDGPAIIDYNRLYKHWYQNGVHFRENDLPNGELLSCCGWYDSSNLAHRANDLPAVISESGTFWRHHGRYYRRENDNPSIIRPDGTKYWYDRIENKPSVEYANGVLEWVDTNCDLSNENGPAIIRPNGEKEYWLHGKRHNKNGPAIDYPDGTKMWWVNGKLHNVNGPAIVRPNGKIEFWMNGQRRRLAKIFQPIPKHFLSSLALTNCSVCLEMCNPEQKLVLTSCFHVYHEMCCLSLEKCPLCNV